VLAATRLPVIAAGGVDAADLPAIFAAGAAGAVTGSLALALLAAMAVGVALSMLHGYACVSHRGDQVVLGMAITTRFSPAAHHLRIYG